MKKRIIKISLIAVAALFVVWVVLTNILVSFTKYTIEYDSLPEAFDGFKIAQVSDLHNNDYWGVKDSVVGGIREFQPDIIALTGDLVDSTDPKVDVALELVKELSEIAPCYYVTGNHEAWIGDGEFERLLNSLSDYGVTVLRDDVTTVSKDGEELLIAGVDDPVFTHGVYRIRDIAGDDERFTVVLSHRPEYYETYKASGVQLVLSGHAHGGQFRLPFIGGIYAPHQGFFPEYDSGVHQDGDFALVVSRGVGNSVFPVRFNNTPEVVLVELCRK